MNILKNLQLPIIVGVLAVLLTACSSTSLSPQKAAAEPAAVEVLPDPQVESADLEVKDSQEVQAPKNKFWGDNVSRIDEQGAVVVEIVPVNPNNPGLTLDFNVYLNTHSVELSMDLTELATLETDTGFVTGATQWDAPSGGHHVSGKLSFPAKVDGVSILENAASMTIRLIDVDAPERIFTWTR